jgi:predicted nucleic acid-binding protein
VTRFAIDAPALLAIAGSGRSVGAAHRLVAPNSIRSDALELLLLRVRGGELSEDAALELHERVTEVKMRLLGDRVSRRTAWRIARDQHVVTIHDAEYLAVAKLQADALIAINPKLAAIAAGVVPLAALTDALSD